MNSVESANLQTSGMRFLLIEDDEICQYLTGNYLRELGGSVDIAETAEKALEYLDENKYTLIFLDIGLPDRNGIELMQEINNLSKKIKTPVIATTGHARSEQKEAYLSTGIKNILEKPISKEDLSKVVGRFALCVN